jgi:hypothetical protein
MLNEQLSRAIAKASREPRELHFVQCSSSLPTGAIILHGFVAGAASARIVVKTPRNPALPHSLQREWESLAAVRRDAALARLTAEGIGTFNVDGGQFFAYSGLPGRTMSAAFRNRLWIRRASLLKQFAVRALQTALLVHRPASQAVPARLVADDLLRDLEGLRRTVPLLPQRVSDRATAAAARIAATPCRLPCGRVHGDFSPHNLMISRLDRGAACIIDWEHMEPQRPQHLDIFRFINSSLLLGMRGTARRNARRSLNRDASPLVDALLHPWLVAMGADASAWTQPECLDALWWHYWIHASRREVERLATTDAGEDGLLQAVGELAR